MRKLWKSIYYRLFKLYCLLFKITPEQVADKYFSRLIHQEVDKIVKQRGLNWCKQNSEQFDQLLIFRVKKRTNVFPSHWRLPDPGPPVTVDSRLKDLPVQSDD